MSEPQRIELLGLILKFNADLSVIRFEIEGNAGERIDIDIPDAAFNAFLNDLVAFTADLQARRPAGWALDTGTAVPAQRGARDDRAAPTETLMVVDLLSLTTTSEGAAILDFREVRGRTLRLLIRQEDLHGLAGLVEATNQLPRT